MKRIILVCLVFLVANHMILVNAQDKDSTKVNVQPDSSNHMVILTSAEDELSIPNVVPPSPDAMAIGKFGNYPVGLNTGIPQIDIPLYTIKTSQLEVPISISYHASGVKVAEIASWVGLGWALNAGGEISVSVVGLPDHNLGFYDRSDIKTASQLTDNDWAYAHLIAVGQEDGESDYYFYNYPGHSGKFIYQQNNNYPFLIPKEPIKINYTTQSNHYEIIDEKGVKYEFTAPEYMRMYKGDGDVAIDYISTYHLTDIISADGKDHITFTYAMPDGYAENNMVYSETIGQICNPDHGGPPSTTYHTTNSHNDGRGFFPLVLQRIDFATGKVEFVQDLSRLDAPKSRLDSIKVYEKNIDGTYTLRKKVALEESYFVTGPGNTTDLNRLKLAGLQEFDVNNNRVKRYQFFYDETEQLPARNSLSQDWWGYYNGQGNSSLIKYEMINFLGTDFYVGGANREPNESKMKIGVLDSIIYPTGGSTKFLYESNRYHDGVDYIAGGLRVKEIRDYEGPGKLPITKMYKYGTNGLGYGTLLTPTYGLANSKQIINVETWYPAVGFCTPQCWAQRLAIRGNTALDLTSLNGAAVVYPEVRVYEKDSVTSPNGKQVFQFNTFPDLFMGVDQVYNNGEFQMNQSWKGGGEIYNGTYNSSTNPLKTYETFNTYTTTTLNDISITGTKIIVKIVREGCPNPPLDVSEDFYYFDYPIYSGYNKLASNTTREYASDGTNYTELQTNYDYNDLSDLSQQLTKKTLVTSAGITDSTRYWYPADYTTQMTDTLKSKNIIAVPIKEEHYRGNKIVDGKVTQYNYSGHPSEIDIFETDRPQTPPARSKTTIKPTGYVKRLDLTYDANQNLQTVTKSDDITTSYVWAYNNSLPIAEVKNATTSAFYFNNFENSDGNSTINDCKTGRKSRTGGFSKSLTGLTNGTYNLTWWSKSSGIWSFNTSTVTVSSGSYNINLTGQVDDVRFLINSATMKTYTYDPLLGMTSVLDENNVATYYEYDDVSRLRYIKDQDGNILQYYDYHYKTSN